MFNMNVRLRTVFGAILAVYVLDGVRKGYMQGRARVFQHPEDARMKSILSRMPILGERYWPAVLFHSAYTQFVALLAWRYFHSGSISFKQHVLTCPDGGEVVVEVFEEPAGTPAAPLPADAPVLLLLHTITGVAQDEAEFCKAAFKRGWRPVILSRRSHAGELRTAKFNLMGCVQDTKLMVAEVAKMYPDSFIGAVGLSAGSGQVVSYIGNQDGEAPVHAAVALCPAYSIERAFANFQATNPLFAKGLLFSLKRHFLVRNAHVLAEAAGYRETLESDTVQDFMEAHVQMAGFPDFDAYLADSNPMSHYHKSKIPCLVLNAIDDPLCVEENIRLDIVDKTKHYALVLTQHGSHVAHREGLLGESSYMHRLSLDFLEAARQHKRETR